MKRPLFASLLALALLPGLAPAAKKEADRPEASRKIDSLLAKAWKEQNVQPGVRVDDETFVRRVYLDIAGRIPTAAEMREFVSDKSSAKRHQLIDELIDSESFTNHMFNYWADILRIHSQQGGGQNVVPAYVRYVKDSLRENKPYDEFVRELVTAEGDTYDNGAIGYYYRDRGMILDNMANTVRIFLGTRLECAQCHNHPFDKWTQMDFFHMAAFSYGMNVQNNQGSSVFQKVQREMNADKSIDQKEKRNYQRALQEIRRPIRNLPVVSYDSKKMPQLPHDYQYEDAKPKDKVAERVIFGADPEFDQPEEKLTAYADWMTSRENPRFTKVIANRMWKKVMGIGLIEPVDEFTDVTAAANPELFAFLEEEMKRQDYDLKAFLRILYKTDVYQREAVANDVLIPTEFAFTGPLLRRMTAEQIWDSYVTLINPTPEMGNWRRDQEALVRGAGTEMMTAALEKKSKEQLIKDVKMVASAQKGMQEKLISLQKQQAEARKNKDQEKARQLSQEANEIRRKLAAMIFERVYAPVLNKGVVEKVSLAMPEGMGAFEMKIDKRKIDQNGRVKQDVIRELVKKEEEIIGKEMDRIGITEEKNRREYLGFRKNVANTYLRAANLTSPAPNGHFLRQFGQSDRETIENSENAASVTQALTLLNGPVFRTVTHRQSVLSRDLSEAETAEDKITRVFENTLSRSPRPEEMKLILADTELRGDKLVHDLAFALLNTEEFLFVR